MIMVARRLLAALLLACLPVSAGFAQTLVTLPSGTGYTIPNGVASDSRGNVFVADEFGSQIKEIPFTPGTGYGTPVVLTAFSNPRNVIVDSAGNLIIAGLSAIYELPYTGSGYGALSGPLATGIGGAGLAFDGSGNLFVATPQYQIVNSVPTGAVHELPYTPSTGYGAPKAIATGLSVLEGIALDAAGNVYATSTSLPGLYKIPFLAGVGYRAAQIPLFGLQIGNGVAIDGAGNLYYNTTVDATIYEQPGGDLSATPVPLMTSLPDTSFITAKGTGALFLASGSLDQVYEIELPPQAVQQTAAVALTRNAAARSTTPPVVGTLGAPPYSYSATLPNGLGLDPVTGLITGTATAASASADYTVTVTDAHGLTATASFSLTVAPAVIASPAQTAFETAIGDSPAPFQPVTGLNGVPPYSYALLTSLPDGLSLDPATGMVSGTVLPSFVVPVGGVEGVYTVKVTDSNGSSASGNFGLNTDSPVTATQNTLFVALTQSNPVTASIAPVTAAGGVAPLSYSVSPALPTGLSLDPATGALAGTASVASTSTAYTVTATDAQGGTARNSFSLAVNAALTATVTTPAIQFTQGESWFLSPVTFSGGTSPVTFSVIGTLPSGLSLSSGGISGTPSAALTATGYSITATDANGATATGTFTLTVNPPLTATAALPTVTLTRTQPSVSLIPVQSAGGTAPLHYFLAGALPAGLSFDAATGTVSGSPSAVSAATSHRVTAEDAYDGLASAQFTLTIVDKPTAQALLQPTALTVGQPSASLVPISASGGVGPLSYSISPSLPSGLSLAAGTGTITGSPTASSPATSYTVTATDTNGVGASASVTLTVDGAVTATQSVAAKTLTQNFQSSSFTPVTGGGGKAPLAYAVSPPLPSGLTLDAASGLLSGKAAATSPPTNYAVTVTDANSATASADFTLAVAGPVTAVQSGTIPAPTQNHAVTAFTPVTGSGGLAPLSYSVAPALPSGMTLASDSGLVSGAPGVAGSNDYVVTVADANGATATADFTMTVSPPVTATQSVTSTVLPLQQAATPFTPVTGAGGTAPLSYSVAPALPAGLSLTAATGAIGGTPTMPQAPSAFTMTVTDTNGATASAQFSLGVGAQTSSAALTASANPSSFGQAVTFTAQVSGKGGTPTGTVTFKDGTTTLFTGTLANGIASYTTSTLGTGSHAITIGYSGDSLFASSTSGLTQLVTVPAAVSGQSYTYQSTLGTPGVAKPDDSHFSTPAAVAIDTVNGYLLIADSGNERVQVLDAGTLGVVATLGTPGIAGSDNAHFDDPSGVGFGANRIFVTDSGNDRIQIFDAESFAYVATLAAPGAGDAKRAAAGNTGFSAPGGVHIDAGRLYVADTGNQRVQIFDAATLAYLGTLGTSNDAHFSAPTDAAVNPAVNEILVADSGNGRVQRFDAATFAYKGMIGGDLGQPARIAYDPVGKLILVADDGAGQRVQVFDALSYTYVLTLGTTGSAGSGNGQFSGPSGAAVDAAHGRLFVGDRQNDRIQIFSVAPSPLLASVLPGSRSVEIGQPATIFASLINAGTVPLQGCQAALPVTAPAGLSFSYQTTNPATNALTGTPNTPAAVTGQNGTQTFLLTFQGASAFTASDMAIDFDCLGVGPAGVTAGVDTVDLTVSSTPIADVIALAATASNNGIAAIPGSTGTGAFAVASDNVGATAQIIVSVDTGTASLPLTPTICQSNPSTGACLGTPGSAVTVNFTAGLTPTFSIFLKASGAIPLDPANSRIFVRFKDTAGALHGSTSVAVETQ